MYTPKAAQAEVLGRSGTFPVVAVALAGLEERGQGRREWAYPCDLAMNPFPRDDGEVLLQQRRAQIRVPSVLGSVLEGRQQ